MTQKTKRQSQAPTTAVVPLNLESITRQVAKLVLSELTRQEVRSTLLSDHPSQKPLNEAPTDEDGIFSKYATPGTKIFEKLVSDLAVQQGQRCQSKLDQIKANYTRWATTYLSIRAQFNALHKLMDSLNKRLPDWHKIGHPSLDDGYERTSSAGDLFGMTIRHLEGRIPSSSREADHPSNKGFGILVGARYEDPYKRKKNSTWRKLGKYDNWYGYRGQGLGVEKWLETRESDDYTNKKTKFGLSSKYLRGISEKTLKNNLDWCVEQSENLLSAIETQGVDICYYPGDDTDYLRFSFPLRILGSHPLPTLCRYVFTIINKCSKEEVIKELERIEDRYSPSRPNKANNPSNSGHLPDSHQLLLEWRVDEKSLARSQQDVIQYDLRAADEGDSDE